MLFGWNRLTELMAILSVAIGLQALLLFLPSGESGMSAHGIQYPEFEQRESVTDYHGVKINDPFSWLEEPNSEDTKRFVEQQIELFDNYTKGVQDVKIDFMERMTRAFNYPKLGCPSRHGKHWYVKFNAGLQPHYIMYQIAGVDRDISRLHDALDVLANVSADNRDELFAKHNIREFLNPNDWSDDHTSSLAATAFTEDGRKVAYLRQEGGSDWRTMFFMTIDVSGAFDHLKTSNGDKELLKGIKFSYPVWTKDNAGVFYNKFDVDEDTQVGTATEENKFQKLFYHKLGDAQSADRLIMQFPDEPNWMAGCQLTHDDRYLMAFISRGAESKSLFYLADMKGFEPTTVGELPFRKLVTEFLGEFDYIDSYDKAGQYKLLIRTNVRSPNYRVIEMDLSTFDTLKSEDGNEATLTDRFIDSWRTVIAEHSVDVMQNTFVIGNLPEQSVKRMGDDAWRPFVITWLRHASAYLELFKLSNIAIGDTSASLTAPLHFVDSNGHVEPVDVISGYWHHDDPIFFIKVTSFLSPGRTYLFDQAAFSGDYTKSKLKISHDTSIAALDLAKFQAVATFYKSKDGTRVPMFLISNKSIAFPKTQSDWDTWKMSDGSQRPAQLYAYGGFSIAISPSFSVSRLLFLSEFDGVYAVICARGGSEYGERWHESGMLHNKQNVFDDVHSAAEWLADKRLTDSKSLVVVGGSNGGLMVAACVNQRPELYAGGAAHVGVMDMLKYHKFTIGSAWIVEYGDPTNSKADFEYLMTYSPLHNAESSLKRVIDANGTFPTLLLITADHDDRVVPLHSHKLAATMQTFIRKNADEISTKKLSIGPILMRLDTKAGHGSGKSTQKAIDEVSDIMAYFATLPSWRRAYEKVEQAKK